MVDTTNPAADDTVPAVAAILHDGQQDVDAMLAEFARTQRDAGRRVRGLTMRSRCGDDGCQAAMVLIDLHRGDEYLVSQPLGSGSVACSADPQGFARASRVLRDALAERPDLVICNRFGGLEATGGGFASELLALLAEGIPVLTVVAARYADAWQRFVGQAPMLTCEPAAWAAWLDGLAGSPAPGAAAG